MCGRFVSSSPPDELAKYFDVTQVAETALDPSYNVAPSNDVYVVVESGGIRRLDTFHWGLIPRDEGLRQLELFATEVMPEFGIEVPLPA